MVSLDVLGRSNRHTLEVPTKKLDDYAFRDDDEEVEFVESDDDDEDEINSDFDSEEEVSCC